MKYAQIGHPLAVPINAAQTSGGGAGCAMAWNGNWNDGDTGGKTDNPASG